MKTFGFIIALTCLLIVISSELFAIHTPQQIEIECKTLLAPEATSYQWFYNGEKLEKETFQSIDELKSGAYKVEITNLKGETSTKEIVVSVQNDTVIKIIIIGDSTASDYNDDRFPRTGWGQVLQPFFDESEIEVVNYALSGRSSKSFLTDANGWPKVLRDMQEGDYLFIQFGHNDAKSDDPDRYTEPYSTYQEYLTTYIDSARARGAHPVLLTPIHRNGWSGSEISDSHGDYPEAMRELAVEQEVPLIDLHKGTEALFESLGKDYVTDSVFLNLSAGIYAPYPDGNNDNTHFQLNGAHKISRLVADSIEAAMSESLEMLQPYLQETGLVQSFTSPHMHGTINGKGVYPLGETVTLTVRPKNGFAIASWSENGEMVSEERTYSFVLESGSRNVTANIETGYGVDVRHSPYNGGEITGEGEYIEGAEVTLTAVPAEGFQFVHWEKADEVVSEESVLSFTMGPEDLSYRALFEEAGAITSVEVDQTTDRSIRVFPNPASNFIQVTSETTIHKVEVFDVSGRFLFEKSFDDHHIKLPVDALQNHLILIKVYTEQGIYLRKLLVQ